MLIAGAMALTIALGYRLILFIRQHWETIYDFLIDINEIAFSIVVVIIACAVILVAFYLIERKARKKTGEKLLITSFILFYSISPFLSNFYKISPSLASPWFGALYIFVVTALSYLFLKRYKIKPLRYIFIIGGIIAPLFLSSKSVGSHVPQILIFSAGSPLYFFWVLCVSALGVRISIKQSSNFYIFPIVFAYIILQFYVFFPINDFFYSLWYVPVFYAFAYFVFYVVLHKRYISDTGFETKDYFILGFGTILLIVNLYFYYATFHSYTILGCHYLINALPFIGFLVVKKLKDDARFLILSIIGVFILSGIFAISPARYIGIWLSLEMLLVITLGFIVKAKRIRYVGYFLLALILLYLLHFTFEVTAPNSNELSQTYFNSPVISGVLLILYFIIRFYIPDSKDSDYRIDRKGKTIAGELAGIWMVVSVFAIPVFFTIDNRWANYLFLIPSLLLILFGEKENLKWSKGLGYSIFALLILYCLFWIITEIPQNWKQFIGEFKLKDIKDFSKQYWGYANLIALGVLLICFRLWFYGTGKSAQDKPLKKNILNVTDQILVIWLCVIITVTLSKITTNWYFYLSAIAAYFAIYKGYTAGYRLAKVVGYSYWLVIVFYTTYKLFIETVTTWHKPDLQFQDYTNMFILGALIISLYGLLQLVNLRLTQKIKRFTGYLTTTFIIWLSVFVYIVGIRIFKHHPGAMVLLFIPMFALIYTGGKLKKRSIEYLGWLHFIAIGGIIIITIIQSDTFRLMQQPIHIKAMAVIEYFCLWLFYWFYKTFLKGSSHIGKMKSLRQLFWILVPLIAGMVLYKLHRTGRLDISIGWWIIALVMFAVFEITKLKLVRIEFYLVVIIASINLFAQSFDVGGYFSGIVALGIILFYESRYDIYRFLHRNISFINIPKKKLEIYKKKTTLHKRLLAYSFYYIGLFVFLVYLNASSNDYAGALLITAAYLFLLTYYHKHIPPMKSSFLLAYLTGYALFFTGSIIFLTGVTGLVPYSFQMIFTPVPLLLSLSGYFMIVYHKHIIYENHSFAQPFLWMVEIVVFHIGLLMSYISILHYFDVESRSIIITFLLLIHGIALSFNAMLKDYRFLSKFSIIMLAAGIIKLVIFDWLIKQATNFTHVLLLGILLIGSWFIWQRLKDRLNPDENVSEG